MATGAKRPASSTSASPFTSSKLAKVAAPGAYDFIGVLGRNAHAADWELVLYAAALVHYKMAGERRAVKRARGEPSASSSSATSALSAIPFPEEVAVRAVTFLGEERG